MFGVAAVFSVVGKAGFCVAVVFKRCCECRVSVAGLVFYVAALVFTVAGTVCIVATWCFMCPHGVFCCQNGVFVAETPTGTHEGSDVTSRCFVLPAFLAVSTRVPGDRISWLSREKTGRTRAWRGRSRSAGKLRRLLPDQNVGLRGTSRLPKAVHCMLGNRKHQSGNEKHQATKNTKVATLNTHSSNIKHRGGNNIHHRRGNVKHQATKNTKKATEGKTP